MIRKRMVMMSSMFVCIDVYEDNLVIIQPTNAYQLAHQHPTTMVILTMIIDVSYGAVKDYGHKIRVEDVCRLVM